MIGLLSERRFRNAGASLLPLVLLASVSVGAAEPRQWTMTELTFAAEREYPDPFDFEKIGFAAEFVGPTSHRVVVPGFWDGERTWRVRFTPTLPGEWRYSTRCHDELDRGLHGQSGSLTVAPPSDETSLRKHGGFLRVSASGHYLTHSDGTPFFWLGDTWWAVPSGRVSYEQFQLMVDTRVEQGFSVFQAHGYTGFGSGRHITVFDAVRNGGEAALRLWQEVDRYFRYAEVRGILAVVGFASGPVIDGVSLSDLKRLWFYYLARYGAFPVTFLITQEYNVETVSKPERVSKVLQLARFIRDVDPYKRAFSVHPWIFTKDGREAWSESWYDFVLVQAGHFAATPCDSYLRLYQSSPTRPVVESETNYEGFAREGFAVDAGVVRQSAYTALQCGAAGFTYGAQGLYAGVASRDRPGATGGWGPVLLWKEGLALPGGMQMAHLRRFYDRVAWWRLEPWPRGRVSGGALARSHGNETVVVYLPRVAAKRRELSMTGLAAVARYALEWFDPRTGNFSPSFNALSDDGGTLRVPPAPSSDDWGLLARRQTVGDGS